MSRMHDIGMGILFVLLVLSVGCEDRAPEPPVRAGEPVAISREFKGQQGPFPDAGFLVIRRPEVWQAFWGACEAPRVDFDEQMALAATMGQQPTAGYAITIVDVRADEERLYVRIEEEAPDPDALVAQVVSFPYHMVIVPASPLPMEVALADGDRQPVPILEEYLGIDARVEEPRARVIRTAEEWEQLWSVELGRPAPVVDFPSNMVVGVFLGDRSTGNEAIAITAVNIENERLVVTYRIRAAETDGQRPPTSPYALAVIPAGEEPVVFVEGITTIAPCPTGEVVDDAATEHAAAQRKVPAIPGASFSRRSAQ